MPTLPDHVGLDFGNHTVKAVQLSNISASPTLVAFASQNTPVGVINSEDEVHRQQLSETLKVLFNEGRFRTRNVIAALPEYSIFTRFLELPGVKREEIDAAVYWQAKQVVPVPMNELQTSHLVLGEDKTKNAIHVLLVAAPKKLVELYISVMENAGLTPVGMETEAIAAGRALFRTGGIGEAVILDLGSQSTDMGIMTEGNLIFSQSISVGSDALTRAIATDFSLEYNQAEEYKRNYGLDETQLEGKIFLSLKPVIESIIAEVRRGVEFYKSRTLKSAPKVFVLIGDGALLPGLVPYLQKEFGTDVQLGNPWNNIKMNKAQEAEIAKGKPAYAVAVGLALKTD